LSAGGDGIERDATIYRHQQAFYCHLSRFGIHNDLYELGSKRGRANLAHVGGSRHDLALISLMEAMQGNGGEWDSASVTVDHLPIFQVERILADNPQRRIWRHVQGFVA
jgi:hypothetical protein